MTDRSKSAHLRADGRHVAHFFDTAESLAETVAAFVSEGLALGEHILLVITPDRLKLVQKKLAQNGVACEDPAIARHLTILDADATLDCIVRSSYPDRRRFDAVVGTIVRDLSRRADGLRAYGEMVDLLAADGDFAAAHRLETLWNELGEQCAFTLLCGYSAVHFGDPRSADALRLLCGTHVHVHAKPADYLSAWLLRDEKNAGSPGPTIPAQ